MKRSNAHEVTLRAVLGMLFMYLCPHLVRRQTLKSPRASRAKGILRDPDTHMRVFVSENEFAQDEGELSGKSGFIVV